MTRMSSTNSICVRNTRLADDLKRALGSPAGDFAAFCAAVPGTRSRRPRRHRATTTIDGPFPETKEWVLAAVLAPEAERP